MLKKTHEKTAMNPKFNIYCLHSLHRQFPASNLK